jgi:hypothetical protein
MFIPYSNSEKARMSILVDKLGRIQISAALKRKLTISDDLQVVLFFDPDTRRIGISTEYPKSHDTWLKVDSKGYVANAKSFLTENDVLFSDGSTKYYYDGTEHGVLAFKASREYTKRIRTKYGADKNGNLESMS